MEHAGQSNEELDVHILIKNYQSRLAIKENEVVITQSKLEQKTREAEIYKEKLIKMEQQLEKYNDNKESPSETE